MNNHTNSFYNKFAAFYPIVDIFLRQQKNVLLREINMLPDGNLLEIGVGNGTHLRKYKRHKIIGIDTSVSMLNIARKRAPANVELMQMDGMSLLFGSEQFDYVVLSHVIAVVHDPEKLMQEVLRVLKPGGKVYILNHFTPNNWLRHVDKAFNMVARLFHFKSEFYPHHIDSLRKFNLLSDVSLGQFSYFKLQVYQKAEI